MDRRLHVFACPPEPAFCAFGNTLCGRSQEDQHKTASPRRKPADDERVALCDNMHACAILIMTLGSERKFKEIGQNLRKFGNSKRIFNFKLWKHCVGSL